MGMSIGSTRFADTLIDRWLVGREQGDERVMRDIDRLAETVLHANDVMDENHMSSCGCEWMAYGDWQETDEVRVWDGDWLVHDVTLVRAKGSDGIGEILYDVERDVPLMLDDEQAAEYRRLVGVPMIVVA